MTIAHIEPEKKRSSNAHGGKGGIGRPHRGERNGEAANATA